jgi:hypothetical protein
MEEIKEAHPIEYDNNGRMKYNPDYHGRTSKIWTKDEIDYLIDWYEIIGAEEMSMALERTIGTVYRQVNALRKSGRMKDPGRKIFHDRIKFEGRLNIKR